MDAPPMGVLATFTYSSTTSPRDIGEWQQDSSLKELRKSQSTLFQKFLLALPQLFCLALPGSCLTKIFSFLKSV